MRKLSLIFVVMFIAGLGSHEVSAQDNALVMDGARYWSQNCTRCHNARSPIERTNRQWITIVQHMRARANLSKTESVAISAFLTASNGMDGSAAATGNSERERLNPAQMSKLLVFLAQLDRNKNQE